MLNQLANHSDLLMCCITDCYCMDMANASYTTRALGRPVLGEAPYLHKSTIWQYRLGGMLYNAVHKHSGHYQNCIQCPTHVEPQQVGASNQTALKRLRAQLYPLNRMHCAETKQTKHSATRQPRMRRIPFGNGAQHCHSTASDNDIVVAMMPNIFRPQKRHQSSKPHEPATTPTANKPSAPQLLANFTSPFAAPLHPCC
jgi:hypothetical protein